MDKQLKLCEGYTIQFKNQNSFYRIYPSHRHSSEDPGLQSKDHISINYGPLNHKSLVTHSSACTRVFDDPNIDGNKCCLGIEHSAISKDAGNEL